MITFLLMLHNSLRVSLLTGFASRSLRFYYSKRGPQEDQARLPTRKTLEKPFSSYNFPRFLQQNRVISSNWAFLGKKEIGFKPLQGPNNQSTNQKAYSSHDRMGISFFFSLMKFDFYILLSL